jgi:hypothetical protein
LKKTLIGVEFMSMGLGKRNQLRRAVVPLAAMMLAGSGCDDEEPSQTVLVVQAAQEQPSGDERGIIVVVQSLGGAWLEFEVSGGTLKGGKHTQCLPAPNSGSLRANTLDLLVYPEQVEAVVDVRLLPNVPRVVVGEAGAAGEAPSNGDELGACGIDARPLKQVIRPVQRVNAIAPQGGTGGGAGTSGAGAGGAGSGAGGTAGTSGGGGDAGRAGSAGSAGAGGTGGGSSGGAPDAGGTSGEPAVGGAGDGGSSGDASVGGAS